MKNLVPAKLRTGVILAIQKIAAALSARGRVLSGPFRGMRYKTEAHMSSFYPKLLGVYERELWESIEDIIAKAPSCIINIGAAEGYYAVGLALRLSQTKFVTFDLSTRAQELLQQLAVKNSVQNRIKVCGECTPESLKALLDQIQRPVLIVDIEGYETKLLDPQRIPKLKSCEVLLEVHELEDPDLPKLILTRFGESHLCKEIIAKPRTLEDLPIKLPNCLRNTLLGRSLKLMLDEQRCDGRLWFHLKPRT